MISWRFKRLVEKLLSVKFVIFVVSTVLLCCGVLGGGEWLTVALTVIVGREANKVLGGRFQVLGRRQDDETDLGSG